MALEITQEESLRLQKHMKFSSRCSKAHCKVPEDKVQNIMQRYLADQSIRSICKDFHIGRNTFYRIRAEFEEEYR